MWSRRSSQLLLLQGGAPIWPVSPHDRGFCYHFMQPYMYRQVSEHLKPRVLSSPAAPCSAVPLRASTMPWLPEAPLMSRPSTAWCSGSSAWLSAGS